MFLWTAKTKNGQWDGGVVRPPLSGVGISLSAGSFAENLAQGTTIATATPVNASNPGAVSISNIVPAGALQMNVDGATIEAGPTPANFDAIPSGYVTFTLSYDDDNGTHSFNRLLTITDVADGPTLTGATSDLATELAGLTVDSETTFDLRTIVVSPTSQTLTFTTNFGAIDGDGFTWRWTPSYAEFLAYGAGNVDFILSATDEDSQELTVEEEGLSINEVNEVPQYSNTALTFEVPEGSAPAVSSSSPADNATGVVVTVDPTVTFDRAVLLAATGTITLYDVTDAAAQEVFDLSTDVGSSPGQVSVSGAVLTIRPTADLDASHEYAIQWSAGALTNLGGIGVAALSDTTTISFTTAAAVNPISTHSTLSTSLVSWWDLDEASGTRADAHGANDLTDTNTVTSTTGPDGDNAAFFVAANSEELKISDASQSGLDITGNLSISVWVKFTSLPTTGNSMWFAGKWATAGNQRAYRFGYDNNSDVFSILAGISVSGAGTSAIDAISYTVSLSTDTWYMVTWTYEASTAVQKLYVGASEVASATGVRNSIHNSSAKFALAEVNAAGFLDGALDKAGVWTKVLTGSEITDLYNSGNGLTYT